MKCSLAVALVLVGGAAGCSKPPSNHPTAFFDWCVSENFGVNAANQYSAHRSTKNIKAGEIGNLQYSGWIPSKTADEARAFVDAAVKKLRSVAQEKGVTLNPADSKDSVSVWKYESGDIHGILEGKPQLTDFPIAPMPGEKQEKVFFIRLDLTEVVQQP